MSLENGEKQNLCVKADSQALVALLENYDAFAFDLDGTIWKGSTLIEGAKEVITLLRAMDKHLFFVTNNSSKSRAQYAQKMTSLGISVKNDEILGSALAAAVFLKSHNIKKAYVIGEVGLVDELSKAGISVVGGPADSPHGFEWGPKADPAITLDPEVTAVVVGLDREMNYWKIQSAMSYLLAGAVLQRKGAICGRWANSGGAGSILVLSGCTTEAMLSQPGLVTKPLLYIDSVADLLVVKKQAQAQAWDACVVQ